MPVTTTAPLQIQCYRFPRPQRDHQCVCPRVSNAWVLSCSCCLLYSSFECVCVCVCDHCKLSLRTNNDQRIVCYAWSDRRRRRLLAPIFIVPNGCSRRWRIQIIVYTLIWRRRRRSTQNIDTPHDAVPDASSAPRGHGHSETRRKRVGW